MGETLRLFPRDGKGEHTMLGLLRQRGNAPREAMLHAYGKARPSNTISGAKTHAVLPCKHCRDQDRPAYKAGPEKTKIV